MPYVISPAIIGGTSHHRQVCIVHAMRCNEYCRLADVPARPDGAPGRPTCSPRNGKPVYSRVEIYLPRGLGEVRQCGAQARYQPFLISRDRGA
ncbi:hypothetical protein BC834DRAFT_144084 [Gloeopeniophorella convolvens]|nr:hypothetical protein BC834DRAFT_144084 [Gloeopeniophorella convolvens]